MSIKTLYLTTCLDDKGKNNNFSKAVVLARWNNGSFFNASDNCIYSKSDLSYLHNKYPRVCLQYTLGVMEI